MNTIGLTPKLISKRLFSTPFNNPYFKTIYHNLTTLPLNSMKNSKSNTSKVITRKGYADKTINNKYIQRKYILEHPITQLLGKTSKNILGYETFRDNNAVRRL
jgi:hypothetical protein